MKATIFYLLTEVFGFIAKTSTKACAKSHEWWIWASEKNLESVLKDHPERENDDLTNEYRKAINDMKEKFM